jgi:hypothetical protein
MIKILNSSLERQAILNNVINPNRFEELNGENTLTFSAILDEKTSTYIDENAVIELDDDYFDIACYKKNQNEDGTLTVDVEAEHISYRLNNSVYDMEGFTSTGTPTTVLTALLNGTGFTVGTVEFSDNVTYATKEKKSRRMMLMEFIAFLGGEVDFEKTTVSILQHRGSEDPKILTNGKNIKVVSKIYNKRERDANGNPLISYTCSPIMLPDTPLALGDEVLLIQKDLGIQEQLRIVRIGYNPYDPVEAEIELANFVSGLEDDIYRIQTTTVAKNKVYNGCRIGPEDGFVAERSDKLSRNRMNATEGNVLEVGDGTGNYSPVFYVAIDTDTGTAKLFLAGDAIFQGKLDAASGTFKGDLDAASGTFTGALVAATGTFKGTVEIGTIYKTKIYNDGNAGMYALLDQSNNLIGFLRYNGSYVELRSENGKQIQIISDEDIFLSAHGIVSIGGHGISLIPSVGYTADYYDGSSDTEIATHGWVTNNFASAGHSHSFPSITLDDIAEIVGAVMDDHIENYHSEE